MADGGQGHETSSEASHGRCSSDVEELSTVLRQVEACLNSRLLVPSNVHDENGIEYLTPEHFLIGKPVSHA